MRTKSPNSKHRPPHEPRKSPGGHYGGARRAPIDKENDILENPVSAAFDESTGWVHRTSGRTSIADVRVGKTDRDE